MNPAKLNLISIYEYLEHRFGVRIRTINSITFLIVQCISSGTILYTTSLILVKVLPLTITEAIILTSAFTAIYTYSGGISTVIWTDVMQSIVLLAGSVAVFFALSESVTDISLITSLPDRLTTIDTNMSFQDETTVWSGLIAMSFLHLSVYATNQLIIQRTLATRSVKHAKNSMLISGYGAFFIYLFFSIIGILLFCFYDGKDFENSNEIILDFVFNHTSPIVVGLVMSSLMAAAMSSLDSAYNSMATVSTFDIYKRFINDTASEEHYEKVSRILSLSCSALIIVPSILAISNESVLKSVASLVSVFVGIRLGSFLLGLFSSSANETGALIACACSILAIFLCQHAGVAWPWFALSGTVVFLSAGYIISQFYGEVTQTQQEFIIRQKGLYCRPTASQYMLLVFAVISVFITNSVPEILGLISHAQG